jgi:hypothetical protein
MTETEYQARLADVEMRPGGEPPDGPNVGDIRVSEFTVSPAAIRAGETVTVDWATVIPSGLSGVTFFLNGVSVPAHGSRSYKPIANTGYSLIATKGGWMSSLAKGSVTVDTSACTRDGPGWDAQSLQNVVLQPQVFAKLQRSAGFQVPGPGPVMINIWINDESDLAFEYDAPSGLIKLTLKLGVSLNLVPGEGSVILTNWYSMSADHGHVVPVSQRQQTDLSLPLVAWGGLLLLILGPGAAALITAALYGLGPSLLGNAGTQVTQAISAAFALFGEKVFAVRIVPRVDDLTNADIVATSCP